MIGYAPFLGQARLARPSLGQAGFVREMVIVEAVNVHGNPLPGIPFKAFRLAVTGPSAQPATTDQSGIANVEVVGTLGERVNIALDLGVGFKYGTTPTNWGYSIGQGGKRFRFVVQERLAGKIPEKYWIIGGVAVLGLLVLPSAISWIFGKKGNKREEK